MKDKICSFAKAMKIPVRVLAFLVVFVMLLSAITDIFQPFWPRWNNYYTIEGFYEEPRNTIETVFLGASVIASGVDPMQLYRDYGICAYNLGTEHQGILTSYYWLEEAYRRHPETLKSVVLDVSLLRQDTTEPAFHKAIDNMRFSGVKLRAVMDYTNNDVTESLNYIVPFVNYHTRWEELEPADFTDYQTDPVTGTRGYHAQNGIYLNTLSASKFVLDNIAAYDTELHGVEPGELYEDSLLHLDMMYEFCQERGIEIVLIKTPSKNWGQEWYEATKLVAEKYDLPYFDFCYEPYISELEFMYDLDTLDIRHLNYYGASKLTKWLGEYLVENCGATDVRGKAGFEHMDAQEQLYSETVALPFELRSKATIESFIDYALYKDCTVFIMAKDEASKSLTDEQRIYFEQLGLPVLAGIGTRDSYIAVIENGELVFEKTLKNKDLKGKKKPLVVTGTLENGTEYELRSGGFSNGNIASCTINDKEYSHNSRGLYCVVYDSKRDKVLFTDSFNTYSQSVRRAYSAESMSVVNAAENTHDFPEDSFEYAMREYLDRIEVENEVAEVNADHADGNLLEYLDLYRANPENVIFIAAKDDASEALTLESRLELMKYGLPVLAKLGFRDSYIACIENSDTIIELTDEDKAVTFEKYGLSIKSAGNKAGNNASIVFDGVDYSPNKRGLNIVVYNIEEGCVVGWIRFDTYSEDITIPE